MILHPDVNDCWEAYTTQYLDLRGSFCELFNQTKTKFNPLQVNCSYSKKNVVRGIHVTPYAKLVNCVVGKIFDVCVDLRKNSPTYLKYTSAILDGTKQLYIPANCGHGFMALEDYNVVVYLQEGTYDPEVDKSLFWADKTIGVKWPDEEKKIISDKDLKAPTLERFWDS